MVDRPPSVHSNSGRAPELRLSMPSPSLALGFRVHSGWAVMIALAGHEVVERRRIALMEASLPVQPYHAAEPLPFAKAGQLIRRSEEVSRRMALASIEHLSAQRVRAACVLDS